MCPLWVWFFRSFAAWSEVRFYEREVEGEN